MKTLERLFANNRRWASGVAAKNPEFFETLKHQQAPPYMWIGCADSRVPANEIVGILPGEMFVHRNVANVVVHTDLNCLSTIQYAVDVLKVRDIIVCGHYGCGGISAVIQHKRLGLIDNWLRHIQDVQRRHSAQLERCTPLELRERVLCELNVIDQVANVCQTTMVQDAWDHGQALTIHGWIYDVADGLLKDLNLCTDATAQPGVIQEQALAELWERYSLTSPGSRG
jgi:carbonic anhydrase